MKRWQFWLGLLVSAAFLWLALRGLRLADIGQVVAEADYLWLLPGVAVYFLAVWARAWRWHYLLRPLKAIPTGAMFPIVCIGYMGNNIYPARAGEVLRAVILKRKEGVPVSASLATIIVERIFDGDNNPHSVEFSGGMWKCDCDFFLRRGVCSHTMALERILERMLPVSVEAA